MRERQLAFGALHFPFWYTEQLGGSENEWGSWSRSPGPRFSVAGYSWVTENRSQNAFASSAERPRIARSTITECQGFLQEYEAPCWLSPCPISSLCPRYFRVCSVFIVNQCVSSQVVQTGSSWTQSSRRRPWPSGLTCPRRCWICSCPCPKVRGLLLAILVTVGPACQDHIFGGNWSSQGDKGRVSFILRKQKSFTSQVPFVIEISFFLLIEV